MFNGIQDEDGTVLVCPHWFVVDDFDAAWRRAQSLGVDVAEAPNADNGTRMRAFVVRDPYGYYVTINEERPAGSGPLPLPRPSGSGHRSI